MAQVFISYIEEDGHIAAALAHGLEEAGLAAWYYERDALPGVSYLRQIDSAIESCEVLVVIISNDAIGSKQMTNEIVRGFEVRRPIVPILWGLSHADFQKLQPEWRGAIGAATSIQIPQEGVRVILPRLLSGLAHLGVVPRAGQKPPAAGQSGDVRIEVAAPAESAGPISPTQVDLTAVFDRTSYPPAEDPLVYCLAKFRVGSSARSADIDLEKDGPGVDVALVLDVSGSMDKPNRYPLLCEAVRRLVVGLGSQDWISVTLFSDRSRTVFPFMPVDDVASNPEQIIRAMNESGLLFGPRTYLAPGLRMALEGFKSTARSGVPVRRTYVLTDGELHDTPECEAILDGFRPQSIEVNVYGFGDGFNAAGLKRLVSDQIGGTVKPIVNEEDITRTFAHVAEVNRRLVGHSAKLEVTLSPETACGDAWVFQPQGRYLGPIRDRRVEYVIGGVESDRWYSLLLEIRLPTGAGAVGTVEASWVAGEERSSHRVEATAVRKEGAASPVPEVRRAVDVLNVLRAGDDTDAQISSYKARRELALLENRDPNLISALDKMIDALVNQRAEAKADGVRTGESPATLSRRGMLSALRKLEAARRELSDEERLMLDSDPCTANCLPPQNSPLEKDLLAELVRTVPSAGSDAAIIDLVFEKFNIYILKGLDVNVARRLLLEFVRMANMPHEIYLEIADRLLEGGNNP